MKKDLPLLRSLLILASVIEARDPYTGGHLWRVSKYAGTLAAKLGLEKEEVFKAELGALVHDLGKVAVSDSILNKKGKLTDDEYAVMKKHTVIGRALIVSHPLAPQVIDAVSSHHERVDGKGYPGGLGSGALPLIPRIISVADAFDAMTSTRPYRDGMSPDKAYRILEAEKGKQFDEALALAFVELGNKGRLAHIISHCGEARLMLTCPKCGPIIPTPKGSKDGDSLSCPSCTGEFTMHAAGTAYELEHKGTSDPLQYPKPDTDTIEAFIASPS